MYVIFSSVHCCYFGSNVLVLQLVESIEDVRETGHIQEEWFGLILLPVVSFAADGCVAIMFFGHRVINHIRGKATLLPEQLAKARAIDLSIQFTLFWMPFIVLLGWWIDKPMHLMFGKPARTSCAYDDVTDCFTVL